MPKLFQAPKLKVKRAEQHIADLKAQIIAYVQRKPYRLVLETDTPEKPDEKSVVVRVSEPIPCDFPAYIGDAIHNLRASLDLLACELVRLSGKSDKSVYFPFAESGQDLEIMIKKRRIDRAAPDVVDIIRALKPYRGGNDALRALHDLDIMDKHSLLIPVAYYVGEPGAVIIGHNRVHTSWFPLEDGYKPAAITGVWPGNIEFNPDIDLPVEICFGNGQPFDGEPVVATLYKLVRLTDGIIQTLEAHIRRGNP
jgi:hypothetical protein